METYPRDWIKNKKYVTQLQTLIAHWRAFWPENNIDTFVYVMSFPRANIGRWGKGRGENIAIFLTWISTSHLEQLCSSLPQTNYSMIVG